MVQSNLHQEHIDLFELNPNSKEFLDQANSGLKYKLFLLAKLPLAFFTGLTVDALSANECIISVPYKWLNKNPFNSMYFAVLAMAAELSTGLPSRVAIHNAEKKTSMLVTSLSASYSKKAKGRIRFVCKDQQKIYQAVRKTNTSGEWEKATLQSIGYDKDNDEVARFEFEWSFRSRI